MSDRAIQVVNNGGGPEGLQSEHIDIRDNQIVQCGYDGVFTYAPDSAAICVYLNDGKGGLAEWRGQKDISIEGNIFQQWQRSCISIGSAQQVRVYNNTMTNSKSWGALRPHPDVPIVVMNSDQVDIADNTIRDIRPIEVPVEADAESGKVEVRNQVNSLLPAVGAAAPMPTKAALQEDARKALTDLLENFWVGTATEGHFTADSWGGAEAADALYAWWKITGSSDAASRIAAHWEVGEEQVFAGAAYCLRRAFGSKLGSG